VRPSPPPPVPSRVLDSVAELPRLAVARTLRAHPHWSLANVFGVIEGGGPRADALGQLTIGDLLRGDPCESIDHVRLARAVRLRGAEFDQIVFEVLCEARCDVGAGYLRARVGGPRWKVQASLGRLVATGKVARSGNTSTTRYRAVIRG
jgi:hypothetical protein